jgi:hypothetical protein
LGLTGLIGSVGGTVSAVIQGVPLPIALMVGYCTLVGAVYLAMAPLAYRALANFPSNAMAAPKAKPDYKVWSHIQRLNISRAAYLWSGLDPHIQSEAPQIDMWAQVMKDAIMRRELPVSLGVGLMLAKENGQSLRRRRVLRCNGRTLSHSPRARAGTRIF